MEGSSSNSAVSRAVMMNVNNNASSSSESQQNHLYPLQSSPLPSPTGNFSNGGGHQIPRSDYHHHHHNHHMNPYPTTFVQANTSTFKQVVQILTGSADTAKQASSPKPQDPSPSMRGSTNFPIPPIRSIPNKKQQQQQQQQQLYERRSNSFKHRSLMINTLLPAAGRFSFSNSNYISSSSPSSAAAEILSPSMLDFPKLTLSPVTPLNQDPFFHGNSSSSPCPSSAGNCSSSSSSSSPLEEEDRAIAEKGFYLHPSPMSTPRESEPQLLTLFPLTSPRAGESSSPPLPPPEP